MKRRGAACLLAYGIFLAIAFPRHVNSQEKGKVTPRPKADINNLMKELLNTKIEKNQTDIALWMPWEAFVEIRTQPNGHDREAIGREFGILKSYMIIVVLSYVDRDDGSRIYANEQDFEETATLKLSTGAEFPLAVGVPPDVLAIGQAFRQLGAINRGENGKNTQVLFFSSTSRDGKSVLDPRLKNALTLDYKAHNEFKARQLLWRTPFEATNPVPPCTKCNGSLSIQWLFCPWCGTKTDTK